MTIEHIDGETDIQFAERYAAALEAGRHEWGADVETALFVAVQEIRRLRKECANRKAHLAQMDAGVAELVSLRSALQAELEALRAPAIAQRELSSGSVDAAIAFIKANEPIWDNDRYDEAAETVVAEVVRLRRSVALLTKYACPSAVRLAAHELVNGEEI